MYNTNNIKRGPPLGIFAGGWISSGTQSNLLLTPIFTALVAGTFLYIGTLHGFDRASLIRHCGNLRDGYRCDLDLNLTSIA